MLDMARVSLACDSIAPDSINVSGMQPRPILLIMGWADRCNSAANNNNKNICHMK